MVDEVATKQHSGLRVGDPALRAYLNDRAANPPNGITAEDAASHNRLPERGFLHVVDLDGIEHMAGLQEVGVMASKLTSLEPFAELKQLRSLVVHHPKVSDLSPLAELEHLECLAISGAAITDLSPLAGLRALTSISLLGNPVSDLSPLRELSQLSFLDICYTRVADLSPLAELATVVEIWADNTPVSDLSPLSGLKRLIKANLDGTAIADLSPLAGLERLEALRVGNTPTQDFSPIEQMAALEELHIDRSQRRCLNGLQPRNHVEVFLRCRTADTPAAEVRSVAALQHHQTLLSRMGGDRHGATEAASQATPRSRLSSESLRERTSPDRATWQRERRRGHRRANWHWIRWRWRGRGWLPSRRQRAWPWSDPMRRLPLVCPLLHILRACTPRRHPCRSRQYAPSSPTGQEAWSAARATALVTSAGGVGIAFAGERWGSLPVRS